MCQPGRPGPQGECHVASAGSPAFAAFHSAKSCGSRLALAAVSAVASPGSIASMLWWVSDPYVGHERTSKYTSPPAA